MKKNIYRVIDANLNRSREGLRVCEEVARFVLEDKNFAQQLKRLRHRLEDIVKDMPDFKKKLLVARDVKSDVGKKDSLIGFERKDVKDVFGANMQRSKEAVRTLEEFFKLINRDGAHRLKDIRFKIYDLEKRSFDKLETLRNIR